MRGGGRKEKTDIDVKVDECRKRNKERKVFINKSRNTERERERINRPN